jgi:hypothetical protein
VKSAVNHGKVHRRTSLAVIPQELEKKRPEWLDVEEIDLDRQEPEQQTLAAMPVIDNIQQWAANIPWEDA